MAENLGYILEANVYVRIASNGVEFYTVPSLRDRVTAGDVCPTAYKESRLDHKVAFCCSSSLRSFFKATARNPDVFSRSIPFWYSVFEYQSPQKSRTIRAL